MKWVAFIAVLALTGVLLWRFGVLKGIAGPFDTWLKWIGAR